MKTPLLLSAILFFICAFTEAQNINKDYILPGKGLKQHDFLYVGEWDTRKPTAQSIFIVRGWKTCLAIQYTSPHRNRRHSGV
jgi:hypothetical protein